MVVEDEYNATRENMATSIMDGTSGSPAHCIDLSQRGINLAHRDCHIRTIVHYFSLYFTAVKNISFNISLP